MLTSLNLLPPLSYSHTNTATAHRRLNTSPLLSKSDSIGFSELKHRELQMSFAQIRQRESKISQFLTKAASIGSSGSEYSESLMGDAQIKQRKRRTVAGVDQEELLDPDKLADPDSFFCEFNGVQIHHKICHYEQETKSDENNLQYSEREMGTIGLPIVLLHGFGASVFSWNKVMNPLARIIGSKVLAFDRPAFGLTTRIRDFDDSRNLNPYSMAFSVLATILFIEMLGSSKAILVGHSAGCLVAVNTYFKAPEKIAALILVAPAILAPLVPTNNKKAKDNGIRDSRDFPFVRVWRAFYELCLKVVGMLVRVLRGMGDMVQSLYHKALVSILRSAVAVMLVRMIIDRFGVLAVKNAWFDASQVTDLAIQGYTKPLRAKGWDIALLEYTISMIKDSNSNPPLSRRLSEISCPVLIVTGDTDRLVPSWNAERLSQAIPDSTFELIKNCGHLPHEERVDEFLLVVERFLQRVFGFQNLETYPATA